MGLFRRSRPEAVNLRDLPAPSLEQRSTIDLSQYAQLWSGMSNGMVSSVDGDSSMRHDAVWSCRTAIAQDVSMYPVDVGRTTDGRWMDIDPPQIIAAPSVMVKPMMWRYQIIDSWLGWGNAWGNVTQVSPNGLYPTRIELLNPAQVSWIRPANEGLRFFVDGRERWLWPVGDLWHDPAYTLPGSPIGMSPIAYHAAKIAGGLNAGKFGDDFFVAGGLPSSILTVDPPPPNKEAAQALKERLLSITRGNREPLVLPKGTEYEQISVNPSDSQFIESQRYSVEQICRIFREDPTDHGGAAGKGSVTYSNRLDAEAARIKRRQFWIVKMQNLLTDLIPRPQSVRLNVNATLMMTPMERHELHALRLKSKTQTVNGVRLLEDEEPFKGEQFNEPGIPGSNELPPDPTPAPAPNSQGGNE